MQPLSPDQASFFPFAGSMIGIALIGMIVRSRLVCGIVRIPLVGMMIHLPFRMCLPGRMLRHIVTLLSWL